VEVRVLTEGEIRSLVDPAAALEAVRSAFVALAEGRAVLPQVLHMDLPERRGEIHVKGAHLTGMDTWSVKAACGFYGNPALGLPVASGVSLAFSAETGFLRTLLFDNGYLTELRTGAAGALATDLLANRDVRQVAIIGSGGQARYQLEALLGVRGPERVVVFGRRRESAEAYAREMNATLGVSPIVAPTVREAVEGSDLVVTTTPAREPIIDADWVQPGTHVTAIGSDLPEKQELDVEILRRADTVVADHLPQARLQGEIHHALRAGAIAEERVRELGALAAGEVPGRSAEDEVSVADLTGLGIQDAALADLVAARAEDRGLGRVIETSPSGVGRRARRWQSDGEAGGT
jgi:ectoine utilization protein EutC